MSEPAEYAVNEPKLKTGQTQLMALAETAPIMVWMTDPHGLCTYLNPEWYKVTGQEPGSGNGFGWLDALHSEDRSKTVEAFVQTHSSRQRYSTRYRLRRSDGTYACVSSWARPSFNADGEFAGFLGASAATADVPGATEAKHRVLTPREREVLTLAALGKTSEEMSVVLDIAPRTVDALIKTAVERLGAVNRTHAAVIAALRQELNLSSILSITLAAIQPVVFAATAGFVSGAELISAF